MTSPSTANSRKRVTVRVTVGRGRAINVKRFLMPLLALQGSLTHDEHNFSTERVISSCQVDIGSTTVAVDTRGNVVGGGNQVDVGSTTVAVDTRAMYSVDNANAKPEGFRQMRVTT